MVDTSYLERRLKGLPSSWCFSHYMPRSLTPAVPPESHHLRFLCIGFRHVKTVANCIHTPDEAELLWGGTSPLRPTMFPVYASRLLFAILRLRESRNTRYGLLVKLCPIGTSCPGYSGKAPYKKHQAALGALTFELTCPKHFTDQLDTKL